MKQACKLLVAGIVFLAATGIAHAETGKMYVPPKQPAGITYNGAVKDSNGNPVRSSSGECVRTNWASQCDPCAKGPAASHAPVIALEDRTVYFDLNKAGLNAKGKKKLDALAKTIKEMGPVQSVRIAGFADRLGGAVYNEKLSKRRADSVRKYLVSKGIVKAKVVETRWFGDTTPATNCPKTMKRAALVACLQRDRRVEVEVEFMPVMYYDPAKPLIMDIERKKAGLHQHHKKAHAHAKAKAKVPAKAQEAVKPKAE